MRETIKDKNFNLSFHTKSNVESSNPHRYNSNNKGSIRGSIKRKRHRALSMFEDTIYNYNYMVNSKGKNS